MLVRAFLALLLGALPLFKTGAPFALFQAFFDDAIALHPVAHSLGVTGFFGKIEWYSNLLGDHVNPLRPADLPAGPLARAVDEDD